ncbi:hypothetical protein L596_010122 [Steinernema carpocapsae]|uniref:Uncharacterized protein n=1 Tax=Steinernema carpocapsae TaxID=34508 RepID=A0A4V6A6T3_STECR|nr:hypothetical protein L596_010122 [Steinernema carpocapsae]
MEDELLIAIALLGCVSAALDTSTSGSASVPSTPLPIQDPLEPHVTLFDTRYPYCPLEQLANNYFHAVTCKGYVRVKMYGLTWEQLNEKVDKLLQDEQQGERSMDCEIKTAYYNGTYQRLFLKIPNLREPLLEKKADREVSYWIDDLGDKEGFIPFARVSNWTVIGRGFSKKELDKLSDNEKSAMNAICEPIKWAFHEADGSFFAQTHQAWVKKRPDAKDRIKNTIECDNDPIKFRTYDMYAFHVNKKDPHDWQGDRDQNLRDRDHFITQVYAGQFMMAVRNDTGNTNYHFIFDADMNSTLKYFNTTTGDVDSPPCFIRVAREDLGELPSWFMLPESDDLPLVDDSIITTTTLSTTTMSNMTSVLSSEAPVQEPKKTAKKSKEKAGKGRTWSVVTSMILILFLVF